jgi:hypothetical protein
VNAPAQPSERVVLPELGGDIARTPATAQRSVPHDAVSTPSSVDADVDSMAEARRVFGDMLADASVEAWKRPGGRDDAYEADGDVPDEEHDDTPMWRCHVDLGSGHRRAVRPDGTVYCGTCHPSSFSEPSRPKPQDQDGLVGEMRRLLDAGALADHPPVRLGPGVVVVDVERAVRADLLGANHDNRRVRKAAHDRLAALNPIVLASGDLVASDGPVARERDIQRIRDRADLASAQQQEEIQAARRAEWESRP